MEFLLNNCWINFWGFKMKYRAGFVSNSSSSSFVVVGRNPPLKCSAPNGVWNSYGWGETEFGWDHIEYNSVHDRVNFAFLQALSVNNQDWLEMIVDVIKETTGATEVEHGFHITESGYINNGYIDHQSCATEGENTEIFNDRETLSRFLFSDDSYIQGGNDN